jgi:beta-galactosidase GanA
MTLTTSADQFLLDGKPFRILSGAMHYFRAVPEYWRDRLEKMRAFGIKYGRDLRGMEYALAAPGRIPF